MNKAVAVLQLLSAALLGVVVLAIVINLVLISTRPETISVVNTMIGEGVLIVCLLAMARILLRKGLNSIRPIEKNGSDSA